MLELQGIVEKREGRSKTKICYIFLCSLMPLELLVDSAYDSTKTNILVNKGNKGTFELYPPKGTIKMAV